jgi:hypothetical protein
VLPSAGELQRVVEHVQASGTPIEQTSEGWMVRDPSQITVILTEHMLPLKQQG